MILDFLGIEKKFDHVWHNILMSNVGTWTTTINNQDNQVIYRTERSQLGLKKQHPQREQQQKSQKNH